MVNSLPESTATATANTAHYNNNAAVVNEQIRTNDAEQLQAKNVEKIQQESNRTNSDQANAREERARVETMLKQRAAQARTEDAAIEAERVSREQAAALIQRTIANTTPKRDAVAGGNVKNVDVAG